MNWKTPQFREIKMDAEIGSYQDDFDPAREAPAPLFTFRALGRMACSALLVGGICAAGCASNPGDESAVTDNDALGAPCTATVTQNTYDGPNYWGTIAFKNGSKAVNGIVVDFDVPAGAHCTNDSVPSGATLSPLNGTGASAATTSNHCKFTFGNVAFASGASKTMNYSTDTPSFSAAKNLVITYPSCGGTVVDAGGGTGGGGTKDAGKDTSAPPPPPPPPPPPDNLVWHKASKTNFTSYPDPGSEECIEFSGCQYEGQFAGVDGTMPLSWVKSHNIAAVHSKDFNKYKLHNLRLRSGSKTIDVVVYDECADSDCSGCCTKNARPSGYLIDLESFTDARFGVPDGQIEWACIDPGCQ